ncbi:hypothetical protein BKA66DRAFT_571550 [Pyrenochaeta sp. MPI-SDFR-AT-0127]|nr:hypothetical protein BKA66DRAFT_571550 [Pyrenochaeta sp. MPI-SDFR-AT-0127]
MGSDHNVDDYGQDITDNGKLVAETKVETVSLDETDHSLRCCICLEAYNDTTHPPFMIEKCSHMFGKPSLSIWPNGTSQNANICPYSRSALCERRTRRPKLTTSAGAVEQATLEQRFQRALCQARDIGRIADKAFSDVGGGSLHGEWLDNRIERLNWRRSDNGVGFGFTQDGSEEIGWWLRRLDWAEVMEWAKTPRLSRSSAKAQHGQGSTTALRITCVFDIG